MVETVVPIIINGFALFGIWVFFSKAVGFATRLWKERRKPTTRYWWCDHCQVYHGGGIPPHKNKTLEN